MGFKEGLKEAWKSRQGVYFSMAVILLPTHIFGPETFYEPMPEKPAKPTIVRQIEQAENRITYWRHDPKIDSVTFARAERTLDSLINTKEHVLNNSAYEYKIKAHETQLAKWEENAINYYKISFAYLNRASMVQYMESQKSYTERC